MFGITPTQVQHLALVEIHEVHVGSPLKPVPLDVIPSLQHTNRTMQLVNKHVEGAFSPTFYVINKQGVR